MTNKMIDFRVTQRQGGGAGAPDQGGTPRGLTIVFRSRPAVTFGDTRLAGRLVANLLDNALRHNVARGGIEVNTRYVGAHAVLSVFNTSPPPTGRCRPNVPAVPPRWSEPDQLPGRARALDFSAG